MVIADVPRSTRPLRERGGKLGRRLRNEHRELEARFRDLHRRAHSGDWSDLNPLWSELCREFEAHMRFEEQELFPQYLERFPDRSDEVQRLRVEHDRIRALLDRLAIEIQLHEIRAHTVDAFIAQNRAHADFEGERFYPWVNSF